MLILLATELWASVSWHIRSESLLGAKFEGKVEDWEKLSLEAGSWRASLGIFQLAYRDEGLSDSLGVHLVSFGAGPRFRVGEVSASPWLALGLGVHESLDYPDGGEHPGFTQGSIYGLGLDAAWAPSAEWLTRGFFSTSYTLIPGWFPGELRRLWTMGLGFEFPVYRR